MAAGLFGKLPSKRDFVAARAPRDFLDVWEPWLQRSLAESRARLADRWVDAYNRAPLWRFSLGGDICGRAIVGALVASVDGVGRAYPLTVFFAGDDGQARPEIDLEDVWFEAAEGILLEALDPAATFESVAHAAADLSPPAFESKQAQTPAFPVGGEDPALVSDAGAPSRSAIAKRLMPGDGKACARRSLWWTLGGEDFPPLAFDAEGMPPVERFAYMLTGAE